MANLTHERQATGEQHPHMDGVQVRIVPREENPAEADWELTTDYRAVKVSELFEYLGELSQHSGRPLPSVDKDKRNTAGGNLVKNINNRNISPILKSRLARYVVAVGITADVLLVGLHSGQQAFADTVESMPLVGNLVETTSDNPYAFQNTGFKSLIRGPMDILGLDSVWRSNDHADQEKPAKETKK